MVRLNSSLGLFAKLARVFVQPLSRPVKTSILTPYLNTQLKFSLKPVAYSAPTNSFSTLFTHKGNPDNTENARLMQKLKKEKEVVQILKDYARCDFQMGSLSTEDYLKQKLVLDERERQLNLKLTNCGYTHSSSISDLPPEEENRLPGNNGPKSGC